MTTVIFASIFGDRLNLNGDQANLFVLQQRLKWAGFESKIVSVANQKELDVAQAHFVLLGHGSIAAWAACEREWPELAEAFVEATKDKPGLAVASGADRAVDAARGSRTNLEQTLSEFCVEDFEGHELLGYKNTTTVENQTRQIGAGIATWLHGPMLAKNPALADAVIRSILGDAAPETLSNENTRKIDEILAGVWQLEKPQN